MGWLLLTGLAGTGWGASTLDRVRVAKALVCGINMEVGDYSRTDDHGAREAFDRDLCRAVAVAILGVEAKVTVKLFPDDETSMKALRGEQVDLLPTLTKDFTHTTGTGIRFSDVVLWDGVGFMVPVASGIERAEELAGKKVCLLDATEVEETVAAWFHRGGLKYNPFPFQEEGEMEAAFVTGGCAAIAEDKTRLAATRIGFGPIAGRFRLLGGAISKDPLASGSLLDDWRFGEIVDWVVQVLIGAEEMGVTQALAAAPASLRSRVEQDVALRRLAGKTHELGARLGLEDQWALSVIGTVGSYGEIYERDLGPKSAMRLEREWNRLVRDGGLIAALPLK